MDYRIGQVIETMKANLRRPYSVSKLARSQQMSASYFAHLFRQETGNTPMQYLKELRLAAAKGLLEETDLKIKEVMAKVGFTDMSHFDHEFRRVFHKSPLEYRNSHKVNTRRPVRNSLK